MDNYKNLHRLLISWKEDGASVVYDLAANTTTEQSDPNHVAQKKKLTI